MVVQDEKKVDQKSERKVCLSLAHLIGFIHRLLRRCRFLCRI